MTQGSTRVAVPGGALEVTANGGTDAPALVFLHYWGGSGRTWIRVLDKLPPGRGWARFDQRGWGSARQLPRPYGLDQLAADALSVVRALGLERYVLAGHSMGGKVAQLVASTRPKGLTGVALIAPAPARPVVLSAEEIQQRAAAYDSMAAVEFALDSVLTAKPLPDALRSQVISDSMNADAPARRVWQLTELGRDITAQTARITVPVLVLTAEHDLVEPRQVLETNLLPYLSAAQLREIPGSGHLLPLEAPDAVATMLEDFAQSLDQTA